MEQITKKNFWEFEERFGNLHDAKVLEVKLVVDHPYLSRRSIFLKLSTADFKGNHVGVFQQRIEWHYVQLTLEFRMVSKFRLTGATDDDDGECEMLGWDCEISGDVIDFKNNFVRLEADENTWIESETLWWKVEKLPPPND